MLHIISPHYNHDEKSSSVSAKWRREKMENFFNHIKEVPINQKIKSGEESNCNYIERYLRAISIRIVEGKLFFLLHLPLTIEHPLSGLQCLFTESWMWFFYSTLTHHPCTSVWPLSISSSAARCDTWKLFRRTHLSKSSKVQSFIILSFFLLILLP